jgi:hypothetical protein
MVRIAVAFAGIGILLTSCVSVPEDASADYEIPVAVLPDAGTEEGAADDEAAVDAVVFDPKNPPIEIYTETMRDIQRFVQKLDALIRDKNYDEWLKLLSPEYLAHISSEDFLATVSQQPRLKSQNIVLKDSRDYFLNVVVMSRAGLQANAIEFLTMTRVVVFTINQQEQRIRIYTFDKTPDSWEIVD